MQIPKELVPVLGSVLAAIVAGVVAFLASVLTKENKVSEFRQAWIDGLRDDISEFVSVFYWIVDELAEAGIEPPSLKNEFISIERMQARIELRLNPKEHAELLRHLHGLVRFESYDTKDAKSRNAAVNSFVFESQKVLKDAWIRVKRGEWTYRLTKWISLLVVAASVAFAILVARGTIVIAVMP
jgi:hypothetical protein